MAKVLFGDGIVGLSGSTGASVYARNRYGYYRRNKVIPINPDTAAQQAVKSILSAFAQQWRTLTQSERDEWEGAVDNFIGTGAFGNSNRYSGNVLFTRLNSVLAAVGLSPITTPPLPSSVPSAAVGTIVIDTTAPTYTAAVADPGASFTLQVFATPPVSPGKSYVKNLYKQIDAVTGGGGASVDFEAAYNAVYGVPPVGTKVFVKIVVVENASGLRSIATSNSTIVV